MFKLVCLRLLKIVVFLCCAVIDMMMFKTGINTDRIATTLGESFKFWTNAVQHFCFTRVRKIKCEAIVEFVLQLAANDTIGSTDILLKMKKNGTIKEHLSKSAMCEARDKIVINVWEQVLHDLVRCIQSEIKTRRFWAIDGSTITLQNAKFGGKFKKSCGSYLPHAYVSMLYDIDYGIVGDVILSNTLDERAAALQHMRYIQKGDVVVMDRGYYSKALFKAFDDAGVHVIFRAKKNTSKKEWSDFSKDILSSKDGIDCRFVKYTVDSVDYMMITNLLDTETNPLSLIQQMYHKRWGIETAYGYVKECCSLANLHGRTASHLLEELYANFLNFNIARLAEYHSINKSNYEMVGGVFNRNVLKTTRASGKHNQKINFKQCISQTMDSLGKLLSGDFKKELDILAEYVVKGLSPIRDNRQFNRISLQPHNKWVHHRNMPTGLDGFTESVIHAAGTL